MPDIYFSFDHISKSIREYSFEDEIANSDLFTSMTDERPRDLPSNPVSFLNVRNLLPMRECTFHERRPIIVYPDYTIQLQNLACRTSEAAISLATASHHLLSAFLYAPDKLAFHDKYVIELVPNTETDLLGPSAATRPSVATGPSAASSSAVGSSAVGSSAASSSAASSSGFASVGPSAGPAASWHLQIRVDVQSWFEYELKLKQNAATIAKTYISELEERLRREPIKTLDIRYHVDTDEFKSEEFICETQQCGQYLNSYLRIPELENSSNQKPLFAIQARKKLVRDLLIFTFPKTVRHYDNLTIAELVCFWEEVFRLINKLENDCSIFPVGSFISLNYGTYESGKSSKCHAHAHVSLSLEAMDALEKRYSPLIGARSNAHWRYWNNDIRNLSKCIQQNTT